MNYWGGVHYVRKKFAKEDLVEMYEAEKALNIKVFHDYLSEYEVGTKSFKTVCNTSRHTKNLTMGMINFLNRLGVISGERYTNEVNSVENLFMIPEKYVC